MAYIQYKFLIKFACFVYVFENEIGHQTSSTGPLIPGQMMTWVGVLPAKSKHFWAQKPRAWILLFEKVCIFFKARE